MTSEDYDRALARIPKWMIALGFIGTGLAGRYAGISGVAGFLIGALAAWLNLRLIDRGVNRIVRLAALSNSAPGKVRTGGGIRIFVQFALLGILAFVILRFTGFNLAAALLGFLVCPAAALMEMVYELIIYGHS